MGSETIEGYLGQILIKLYRPRSLNPVVDQREDLPLLPFGNPIGFVPAASRGVPNNLRGQADFQ